MLTSNLRISSTTDTVDVVAVSSQVVASLDDWSPLLVCSAEDRVSLKDLKASSLVLSLDDRASLAPLPRSLDEPTPLSRVLSSHPPLLLASDSPDSPAHIRGLGVGEGALASESLPDGKMM